MRWKKLGKIFDPGQYQLHCDSIGFAQSPQVLIMNDCVRIYFSTRTQDSEKGKYLSHISYVDMSKDFKKVLSVSKDEVIPLGELGCFDEHGIFPMNVLRVGDEVYGYTCGWSRRQSVPVETAIGLSVSRDGGRTFERVGKGPVLAASQNEPYLVGDGFVQLFDGSFHMWYIFGTSWRYFEDSPQPERTYKIGHATSGDGISWIKEDGRQIVPDKLGIYESQALPSVVRIGSRFHMFFCYRYSTGFREQRDRGYRIGHCWSDDLSNWVRDDSSPSLEPTDGSWDSDMVCYPHAFHVGEEVYLLYNGNAFGRDGFGLAVLER